MEHKTVVAFSTEKLDDKISALLKEGWRQDSPVIPLVVHKTVNPRSGSVTYEYKYMTTMVLRDVGISDVC